MARTIGPYRILEALGSGARGEVYLAEDTRLGRRVAIKTLAASGRRELAEARRWMLREARAAARLNHAHIASIYDILESPEGAHIVMEYVPGETLAIRLGRGPVPPEAALEIAIQLTEALAEAHSMGVVHRDLKPANVMMTSRGSVKVLDFGVAAVRDADPASTPPRSSRDFTLAGRQVGTLPYMPPEHLMGDPVSVRGDIYSLGVTLFELVTGQRPFQAPDAMALTMAILNEPTPRASHRNPAVSPALDAIILRAMSRLPQHRYASAAEMADDLHRAARGATPAELARRPDAAADLATMSWPLDRPISKTARVRAPGRARHVLSVAGLGLVVALALYALWPPAPTAGGLPVVAVLPLAGVGADPREESLAAGIADSLISTLSRVPGLTVVSRSATLPYRDRQKDTGTIARELGATVVVDGALQRSGDKLRVALSVLRPDSRIVAWSNTYEGSFGDIFRLQNQVSAALTEALRPSLSPAEREKLRRPPTSDVDALAEYAQGRAFLERPDVKGNVDRAIDLLTSAAGRDPRFAAAHAALADAYLRKQAQTRDLAWALKAQDSMMTALTLDPDDSAVRYALALVDRATGKRKEAIEELRIAIRLRPANDEAHSLLGEMLAADGRLDEGVGELRQAIALHPNFWSHHHVLAMVFYRAGRYPEALAAARREVQLQPDNSRGYQLLGTIYHAMGDKPQAIANYEEAIRLGSPRAYSNLGTIYYADGRFAEAAHAYEQAARLEPMPAKYRNLGDVYVRLGRTEEATAAYRKAVELSRDVLRANPKDADVLGGLAVYEAKLADCAAAGRDAQAALALSPASGDLLYRSAVVHALCGNVKEGLRALEEALAHGYSREFVRQDQDLAALSGQAGYKRLVASAP